MEENSAAVECLIRFYINTKYFLKTRLLHGTDFIYEMVKYCKQQGFHRYSDKEIKNTWKKLVSKYVSLKTKGSTQEREAWKYFEILDSCYEESDFPDGIFPKFSEEMTWFLIECFLKRKTLGRTQKHKSVLDDIHKEFLLCGYLNVTKHDIENKWKYLNLKYEKEKHDLEKLKKFPYLQALSGFHKENETELVSMVFTKDLTEILIECYTEKKISCIIHGYDSDQVLSEIQTKFKKLGFYFSKEAIKETWRKLTNIYKFLLAKGESKTSWVYFSAMRNHFNDDYLLSCKEDKMEIGKQEVSRGGRLRHRSKSVGAKLGKINFDEPHHVVNLSLPEIVLEDNSICINKNESVKRTFEDSVKSILPRKRGRPRKKLLKIEENHLSQNKLSDVPRSRPRSISESSEPEHREGNLNKISSVVKPEKLLEVKKIPVKRLKLNDRLNSYKKLKISESPDKSPQEKDKNQPSDGSNKNDVYQNQNIIESRSSADKVSMLSVDQLNIDQKNEKAIGLTPIRKQFDNELLPFKKRLRVDIDRIDKSPTVSEEVKIGTFSFPVTELENQYLANNGKATKQVVIEINKEMVQNDETNNKLDKCGSKIFQNCQPVQDIWQSQNVSQIEQQESFHMQNSDIILQNPCSLLIRKIDSTVNNVKDSVNEEEIVDLTKDTYQETEETMQGVIEISSDFMEVSNLKRKGICQTEDKNLSHVNVSQIETSIVYNNISEIVPNLTDNTNFQVDNYNSNFNPSENGQVCMKLNESDSGEVHNGNNEFYPTEHCYVENKHSEVQERDVTFRKPFPVAKTTVDQIKWCPKTNASDNSLPNITKTKFMKNKIFISRQELNKLSKLKLNGANVTVKQAPPRFKFISQIIKPASTKISTQSQEETNLEFSNNHISIDDSSVATSQSLAMESKNFYQRGETNEEFESESVISEAVGDDGLKDNLLATVIDFQEQNNQEFIEIKNLMKQNNLLQRETNRLLRLLLDRS